MQNKIKKRGFSLIELLVVLTILGLLATIVGPRVMSALGGGKTKTAQIQIKELSSALDMFNLHVSRYPTSDEGLAALIERPSGLNLWQGPYLTKKTLPKDPWSREYLYRYPSDNGVEFDLFSLGADGSEGGEGDKADINNWD
jgi:general secretion pathway protein G